MADHKFISIRGAREHNLKNVDLDLPRDSLIVMTGHDENRVREELGQQDIPILSKPVRPSELRSTMIALSVGRERNRQAQAAV